MLAPLVSGADPAERTSGLADRKAVALTIYNADLALVHDRRTVALDRGENRIAWRDVGAQMDATTAILEDLSTPGAVSVIEQNFDYDLLTPQALLEKYVGRDVTVVHAFAVPGRPQREAARILSTNQGIVLKYADRIETEVDGHLEFPGVPDDLRDRPTLILDIQSDKQADPELDLSYLTKGLSWQADYVGSVSADGSHVDLNGLVTLSNTSGTSFENAQLQLVAGNVNLPPQPQMLRTIARVATSSFQPPLAEQNFFEYHLYTLGRTTTIANNQTKQVALLSAHGVPLRKTLELRGDPGYYRSATPDLGDRLKVGVYETFTNAGGELGVPLPGGTVRLYQNDAAGNAIFLGADRIDHTPKNEDVRLHVGDSFDVTAHKKQTNFQAPGDCSINSSYEIVLKNAKDQSVVVDVVEPIPGDWTIPSENLPHEKSSSSTATWHVTVPAGGSAKLDYTAHVKLCI